ncbi:MAG: ABC-ATPase domain-containing protein [Candidatus Tectomicrobia bacterium]|uniref:ABC-ATPase domain-containing protein n=1 Tax=Tectimicrobiota bacterium TaxID=2528274 RepID=A0A932FWI7_UNCTE|nr:ABC-ATPase domain-containing protein [Candidatus Tectomicrobia bacterium]
MPTGTDLQRILNRIDGRGYKAYKEIEGTYEMGPFVLLIDHVQGDPFAAPSRVRVRVPQKVAGFPSALFSNPSRRVALEDFLTRAFGGAVREEVQGRRGTGKSGLVAIDIPGQEVLPRTSMRVDAQAVEARFVVGLPAAGRTVLGRQAIEIFTQEIPALVSRSLYHKSLDPQWLLRHVQVVEDQDALRALLPAHRLVAFLAHGALLPRHSGVDDRPLSRGAVLLQSPPEMEVTLEAPNAGPIRGMGIPEGITLIGGGGFHGKSTLLQALERGVYNHIPGDGREYVVTRADAVKIRAEDGRYVEKVDISPFINHLPFGQDTVHFSTENASGSTSQAANIMEALEVGCRLLLIDEDTSATNFMIRDVRMQRLVSKEKEPITPFIDKVEPLYRDLGVSTILVMGGSGDYFDVAHRVIVMDEYRPRDVTHRVREILAELPTSRRPEGGDHFGPIRRRRPLPEGFDPSRGRREVKIDAKGLRTILFGEEAIDLSSVEQLVDPSQTRAIGQLIYHYSQHWVRSGPDLSGGLRRLFQQVAEQGLESTLPFPSGNYALPRLYEVAAAVNRLRTLRVASLDPSRNPPSGN